MRLAKCYANAKQNPKAELLLLVSKKYKQISNPKSMPVFSRLYDYRCKWKIGHIDTTKIDLGLEMNIHIVNTKRLPVW